MQQGWVFWCGFRSASFPICDGGGVADGCGGGGCAVEAWVCFAGSVLCRVWCSFLVVVRAVTISPEFPSSEVCFVAVSDVRRRSFLLSGSGSGSGFVFSFGFWVML
ncbi:hypothetical protein QL285_067108 [Trifolium repens]|nr:hypothetical protein QL285_067108 [Trifolium repens]